MITNAPSMSVPLFKTFLVTSLGIFISESDRLCYTKTKTTLFKAEFELAKKAYLKSIKTAVADGKIPKELVINWHQTGVNVVPASQWTQNWRSTITVAGAMSGQILPFQVLYEGKTERCHPSNSAFPEGFDIGIPLNHWLMHRQASDLSRISLFPMLWPLVRALN